jgi:GT2 family glycosyltransferase
VSRIVAVVVTYRRTDLLIRCVDAVLAQTRPPEAVVVVDNGGIAREALGDRDGVEIVDPGQNLGPAGGYEMGFREALGRAADKVWTVDDDVVPDPDCLERLEAASSGADVCIPLQRKPSGEHGGVDREHGHPPSWNGVLFDAEVIRAVGTPRGELFFWAEDTEFHQRIRWAGFPIRPVRVAGVLHLNPGARERGGGRDWQLYYEVRNGLYVRLRLRPFSLKQWRRAWGAALGKLGAIVLLEPRKGRSLRLWWMGWRDYRRGRLGKVVDPETWRK